MAGALGYAILGCISVIGGATGTILSHVVK